MAAYNRRLVEVCGATGTECVDLVAQIEPSTASFYDDCHFNDAGAQRVGQIVASAMTADEDHPLVTKNRPEATVEEMARLPDRRSGSETGVSQDSRP